MSQPQPIVGGVHDAGIPVTVEPIRVSPDWLRLREPADAAAHAADLAEQVQRRLAAGEPMVIHDLGCGTGAMGRWLAPRLAGPQHWVMSDRDGDLLAVAATEMPAAAADGTAVTFETQQCDITQLDSDDLADADLITASALLDMLTADELERLVTACAGSGAPVLLTISVVGRVELTPPDPLDERITRAFNDHQRRTTGGWPRLGPDAFGFAVDAFSRLGADVLVGPSPWRLGPEQAALTAEWFTGWVDAACEQQPELTAATRAYVRRRLAEAAAGRLGVTVHHQDLLALPR